MYFFRTPLLVRKLFPGIIWQVGTKDKVIYLTFDDGPVPEATPWVLNQLRQFDARATFFMVGENITKHPMIYKQVVDEGHQVGNHTYNHLRGWKTKTKAYLKNFDKAAQLIDTSPQSLFRPPYGQLTWSQLRVLQKKTKVVMWDVLSGDFDKNLTAEQCLKKTVSSTRPGSIVVFHDSVKTITLLKEVLPGYLEHFAKLGYKFATLQV